MGSQLHVASFEDWISMGNFSTKNIIHGYNGNIILNSEYGVNFIFQSTVQKLKMLPFFFVWFNPT